VGSFLNRSGSHVTLAEAWDGTTWVVQPTPALPSNGVHSGSLNSVACRAASFCMAVGTYQENESNSGITLAEEWNGSGWSLQSTPSPGLGDTLESVSCPAAGSCTAVGHRAGVQYEVTLAMAWNGSTWTLAKTPNPASSYDSELIGVSCRGVDDCAAVGWWSHVNTGRDLTLAESWNGFSWKIEPAQSPGTVGTALSGDSCRWANPCIAVGSYWDGSSGPNLTLAERRG
jgi:hypothetical protein